MKLGQEKLYCEFPEDYIARVVINNPPLNLMNESMLRELIQIFRNLSKRDIRAVILTGAGGRAFSAGDDVGEMTDEVMSAEKNIEWDATVRNMFLEIENFPTPVIAAIDGYALGGGLELALCCDIRIASTRSKLGLTEPKIGLIASFGGTQRLPRLIGIGEAKKMVYTGEKITAEKALEIGLVQEITSDDLLIPRAMELCRMIAGNAPIAVRATKASINHVMHRGFADGCQLELEGDILTFHSHDSAEGMSAFSEKRTPIYKNC